MSGRIAVVCTAEVTFVASVFAEAASHVATQVQVAPLTEGHTTEVAPESRADMSLLEWADGIAFGTPGESGRPAAELMEYLEGSERLWRSGRLYDKVVTVFTDQPQQMAPDSILHPIYDVLYRWGAVIVGPRHFDLLADSQLGTRHGGPSPLERAARYRAYRFSRLASVIAEDRIRRESLQI